MKNHWDEKQVAELSGNLAMCVYTSQLLGSDADLVMHGGGNTSVKGSVTDVFGQVRSVLFVKGSGWDLRTIEAPGFPAVDLDYLRRLGQLQTLSDSDMMKHLRLALLDPAAPTPSVEAILHALIPHRFVDHSHADAVVALSNTPDGENLLHQLYGDEVLILPYIMPGFILAQQVAAATKDIDWEKLKGIVLLHHGIFTFAESAKQSYDTMIELVARAEGCLRQHGAYSVIATAVYRAEDIDFINLARLRRKAADELGRALLLRWEHSAEAAGFAGLPKVDDLVARGPLTPDHGIHTKAFGAALDADPIAGLNTFIHRYQDYFDQHHETQHQCLDRVPRFAVWRNRGMIYFAPGPKSLEVVADITTHTIRAIQWGEALGGWTALPHQDLFDVEYWELEQEKLKAGKKPAEMEGKVAIVTGAASGIGKAIVIELLARGAAVIAMDIAAKLNEIFAGQKAVLPIICNVTDTIALKAAVQKAVQTFGGVDIVISNAGNFPDSAAIADMDDAKWNAALELNLSSHMKLMRATIPFLQLGIEPAVVVIASKNVPAPGPGAAAYSAAKAGLTQLARVAALELGA
ncbi:MAG: SDR family NAD(P)-dependent oxidoreductase, partial [Pseudohongiellaceae bacterium]